ncbi:MAG: chorismate-binding protein, partial [Nocardioidaceae bacterium]|nr:chorismate-binding protein [Nocardioidaceae bacterium]
MTDRAGHWVEAFVAGLLRRHDRVWWLDGAAGRSWSGRASLVGWLEDDEPSLTYDATRGEVVEHRGTSSAVVGDDLFAALRSRIGSPGWPRRWFGWAGYASRSDLPALVGGGAPDACWLPAPRWVLVDHVTGIVRPRLFDLDVDDIVVPLDQPTAGFDVTLDADWTVAAYRAAFDEVQDALRAGHTYEVNLTYRHRLLGVAGVESAFQAYRRLRRVNPAPYAGFLHHRGTSLLASSPERFARVGDGLIDTRPVKGTV